ncbi:MAG: hypothetical protein ACFBSE_20990 [Prochloraceae cyanobacterium]
MKLIINIECDRSVTRIAYKLWDSNPTPRIDSLTMKPEIKAVSSPAIKEIVESYRIFAPAELENLTYLSIENESILIGEFATRLAHLSKALKPQENQILYRVLGAIGLVLKTNEPSCDRSLPILLGVLLPIEDCQGAKELKIRLAELLSSYQFNGKIVKLNARAKSILVRPFGFGLALAYRSYKGKDYFKTKKIGVVRFALDSISGLVFENGSFSFVETNNLGLNYFLDLVIAKIENLKRQDLIDFLTLALGEIEGYADEENLVEDDDGFLLLAKSSFPNWPDIEAIKMLSKDGKSDLNYLCQILDLASVEYRTKVREWLAKNYSKREFELLIIGGEAVKFLQQEIEEHCQSYRPVTEPTFFEATNSIKYLYSQNLGLSQYYAKEDSEPHIELTSDRCLAILVKQELNLSQKDREIFKEEELLVDNFAMLNYLLSKEKESRTRRRELSTLKGEAVKSSKQSLKVREARVKEIKSDCFANNLIESKKVEQSNYLDTFVENKKVNSNATFVEQKPVNAVNSRATFVERNPVTTVNSPATFVETKQVDENATFVEPKNVNSTKTYRKSKQTNSRDTFVEYKRTNHSATYRESKKSNSSDTFVEAKNVKQGNENDTFVEAKKVSKVNSSNIYRESRIKKDGKGKI